MSIPKNPNTIIIKNKIYPQGLTEGQVWNYYHKWKSVILNNTQGRDLMFAIMVDVNKPILKRRGTVAEYLQLNNDNYEQIITGRTIAIYSTMKTYEDFCIIDIDTDNWNKAIEITSYIYNIMQKADFINRLKILYTGKNSFHIHCYLSNKFSITKIKIILSEYIQRNQTQMFTIQQKRTPQKPNIDLSPNKYKGAYITEGSLSIWGLRCIEVPLRKLKSFKQWNAKI